MTTPLPEITPDTLLEEVRTQRELLLRLAERVGFETATPAVQASPPEPTPEAAPDGAAVADLRLEYAEARREFEEMIGQSRRAEEELKQRNAELEAADRARADLETSLAAASERLRALQAEISVAEEKLHETDARHDKLTQAVAEAERLLAQAEPIRREKSDVEAKLALLASQEAEYRGYKESYDATQALLGRLWPDWLRDGPLTAWREELERAQFQADAAPSAALLFSALHSYRASLRETSDTRVLLDAVREVSRRLYQWLKDLGKSEDEAAGIAQAWAAGINRECEGKAEAEVPMPGDPADSTWMSFRPGAGVVPLVLSVQTWCVRDAQKRPLNKAQITV